MSDNSVNHKIVVKLASQSLCTQLKNRIVLKESVGVIGHELKNKSNSKYLCFVVLLK
jgi:hypothetical protein